MVIGYRLLVIEAMRGVSFMSRFSEMKEMKERELLARSWPCGVGV